jgi:hypothetical protein
MLADTVSLTQGQQQPSMPIPELQGRPRHTGNLDPLLGLADEISCHWISEGHRQWYN